MTLRVYLYHQKVPRVYSSSHHNTYVRNHQSSAALNVRFETAGCRDDIGNRRLDVSDTCRKGVGWSYPVCYDCHFDRVSTMTGYHDYNESEQDQSMMLEKQAITNRAY